jgi:hypothetical protein
VLFLLLYLRGLHRGRRPSGAGAYCSLSLSLSLSLCVCALPCRPTLGWWLADGREWCCDGSSVGALLRESKWGEGGERRSQLIFTPVEKPSICLLVFQAATIVPPTPN